MAAADIPSLVRFARNLGVVGLDDVRIQELYDFGITTPEQLVIASEEDLIPVWGDAAGDLYTAIHDALASANQEQQAAPDGSQEFVDRHLEFVEQDIRILLEHITDADEYLNTHPEGTNIYQQAWEDRDDYADLISVRGGQVQRFRQNPRQYANAELMHLGSEQNATNMVNHRIENYIQSLPRRRSLFSIKVFCNHSKPSR